MPTLEITNSKRYVGRCELKAGSLTAGRQHNNMLVLDNPGVSRHHLRIDTDPTGKICILEDLGSLNGTFVNGKQVGACLLQAGDEVSIGQFLMKFQED